MKFPFDPCLSLNVIRSDQKGSGKRELETQSSHNKVLEIDLLVCKGRNSVPRDIDNTSVFEKL